MSKNVFKPFWSYDVISTEKWLSKMTAADLILKEVHFKSRIFVFEEEQPLSITYQIIFDKGQKGLTKTLENCGWNITDKRKAWSFVENRNQEISLFPQRESIIAKTKNMSFVTFILLILMICYEIFNLGIQLVVFIYVRANNTPVEYVPAPYPILDLVPYIFVFLNISILTWLIFTFIKTRIGLKKLSLESGFNVSPELLGDSIGNTIINKKIEASEELKIRKHLWPYDFVQLTEWLEHKALEGLKLKYIKKRFTFIFERTRPCKIKYFVDTQKKVTQGYYEIHTQAGYNLVFDSKILFGRVILWSKEYTEGSPVPEMFNNNEERLDCAKRLLRNSYKWTIYWLLLGASQIFIAIKSIFLQHRIDLSWLLILLVWIFCIMLYLFTLYMSIRGYQKVKRKIMQNL